MTISRTTLSSSTSVDDRLAFCGMQEWRQSGVGLLKGLLYQFTDGTTLDFAVGSDGAGYDATFYGTTEGKYAMLDKSADRFEILGGADLYMEGSSASHYLLWDGDNTRLRSTGKVDFRFVGSTSTYYCEWDASSNILQTKGGADFRADGSSASNYIWMDASSNRFATAGKVDVRFVGSDTTKYIEWDASDNRLESSGHADIRFIGTTAANYMEWDASTDTFQTGGKADVSFVTSGSTLDKRGSSNKFDVDASEDLTSILTYLQVSTVGASSVTPGAGNFGFYMNSSGALCAKFDSGGGNYLYGELIGSSVEA